MAIANILKNWINFRVEPDMKASLDLPYARLFFALCVFVATSSYCHASTNEVRIFESYPPHIKEKINVRSLSLRRTGRLEGNALFSFIKTSSIWKQGRTVTVAFRGGDPVLWSNIANTASLWMAPEVNLHLDFGPNASTGVYRTWTTADTNYSADVRVAFDQPGYWSFVGTDSNGETLNVGPGETSLNLERFDSRLPSDWQGVVLHEFGHALGFMHEHQSPAMNCESEFRWEDDQGYEATTNEDGQFIPYYNNSGNLLCPGVYRVLGGPPNNWDKAKVDDNMRHIPNSRAYKLNEFDVKSIMMYTFDAWMYLNFTNSPCYTDENKVLSTGDRAGIGDVYPVKPQTASLAAHEQIDAIKSLLRVETLEPQLRQRYGAKLNKLQ